jgi:hypothetical protein
MNYILAISFATLLATNAFAGSRAEDTAMFRLKVAACKAESKDAGIKTSSADFYSHMAGCLDRTTVAVNVAPGK